MNMFKSVKAKTVAQYLAAVPADRKELVTFLHKFIQKAAPKLKPHFAYNMLGYGSFPYKSSYQKETLEWPVISLANQKNYISIYVCAVNKGKYLAETYAKELGKVSVGKSCIRFKKIEDVHLPTLKKIITLAAKQPGFSGLDKKGK
jgi:uncharacterized protein YdhG (YjbR/CyaY superfamily)